ncbi:MAG: chemotaxis protein CheW [Candidatus Margulisiibacteriota bacterium]|jgi:purine-binding chemotaxis protein CheW
MNKKILIFIVHDQEYAMEIDYVKEVIKTVEINPLPQVPDYVKGIINYRGKLIHIFEIKKLLGQKKILHDDQKKIIIVNINNLVFGFLVDDVIEVKTLNENQIDLPKDLLDENFDAIFFNGIIKLEARIIYLLNIESILNQKHLLFSV